MWGGGPSKGAYMPVRLGGLSKGAHVVSQSDIVGAEEGAAALRGIFIA